jgi:hypothetical protein
VRCAKENEAACLIYYLSVVTNGTADGLIGKVRSRFTTGNEWLADLFDDYPTEAVPDEDDW